MDECKQITVHSSRYPTAQARIWRKALEERRVPTGFLYEGLAQAEKWLALHRACSPAQTDNECKKLYSQALTESLAYLQGPVVHLAAICPGDASKESGLIDLLRSQGKIVQFTAADTSHELLLTSHERVTGQFKGLQTSLICMQLEQCSTLPALLKMAEPSGSQRIVTFFGTLHNFAPDKVLHQILKAVRSGDLLLLSANLAPEATYENSLQQIITGYNNPLSEAWFWGALINMGLQAEDGDLKIETEEMPGFPGLKRITACFRFRNPRKLLLMGNEASFQRGEVLKLFFSCRFTGKVIQQLLHQHGLSFAGVWENETEGVYLCKRS